MLYRVRTLTSHNAEESENSPESPHLGEIKRMRKQCVPGASPFFARAEDEATSRRASAMKPYFSNKKVGVVNILPHNREEVCWYTKTVSLLQQLWTLIYITPNIA